MDSFQFKDDCREVVSGARMVELLSPFPSLRETSQSVHAISLRNKSYTLEAAEVLAEYLANLSDVRRADLADMIAGRPEEEALKVLSKISTALQGHQLQELDLSDNALGEKGVRACFPILQNQNQLEKMFFCNNGLSAAAAECIVDEVLLFRGLDAPTSLKVFHFYNNMSGDGGAVALGKLLPLSPRLEDLRFSATRAQRAGALAFAKQLACLRELIYLDLSDNTFAEEGGQAIAAALKHQRNLRKLNLRDASLGDIGMIAICKALVSSMATTSLEVFDISGNDLTAKCMPFVARVVERNPNLRHLMLEENEIGSKGIKILARTISKMSTCSCKLLEVFVSNFNEITSSGAVSIIDALKSVRTLKKIQIDGNNISAEAIEKIKDILETNNMGEVLATFEDNDEDDDEDDDNETDDDEDKEQMDAIENADSSEDVDGLISSIENIHIEGVAKTPIEESIFSFESNREVVDSKRAFELLSGIPGWSKTKYNGIQYDRISLCNKSYNDEGSIVLSDHFLKHLRNLRVVDLADMIAGRPEDEALRVLNRVCSALQGNMLNEIDLSDNALGEKGVRACFGILAQQHDLEHLSFCNNGISARAAEVIAEEVILFRGNDINTKLKTFNFYNNMSGDGGAYAFSKMLPFCPDLTKLRFSATRAGRKGSASFAVGMQSLSKLVDIDLCDTTFGVEGAESLAAALEKQPNLVKLNLRDTSLEDKGLIMVLDALIKSKAMLDELDLSGNDLTEECMPALKKFLSTQRQLKVLQLEENEIQSSGAKILAEGLKSTSNMLEVLVLSTNEITASGACAVVHSLENKSTLRKLELDGNIISQKGLAEINQLLEKMGKGNTLGSLEDNEEEESDED